MINKFLPESCVTDKANHITRSSNNDDNIYHISMSRVTEGNPYMSPW